MVEPGDRLPGHSPHSFKAGRAGRALDWPSGNGPAVARFHATGGAETFCDGAGVPAALRVPDARCGRRRVRLRVRGGPGDASRRVPAMWARGGPTASVWQEAASARAAGGAVRAPEREALRRPSWPATVRDVRGRERRRGGQGAWQASLPALWRVKRAPRLGSVRPGRHRRSAATDKRSRTSWGGTRSTAMAHHGADRTAVGVELPPGYS